MLNKLIKFAIWRLNLYFVHPKLSNYALFAFYLQFFATFFLKGVLVSLPYWCVFSLTPFVGRSSSGSWRMWVCTTPHYNRPKAVLGQQLDMLVSLCWAYKKQITFHSYNSALLLVGWLIFVGWDDNPTALFSWNCGWHEPKPLLVSSCFNQMKFFGTSPTSFLKFEQPQFTDLKLQRDLYSIMLITLILPCCANWEGCGDQAYWETGVGMNFNHLIKPSFS